jgi:hypothetical protein
MPTTTISTTLLESVNIVLANLGESPVNSLSGGALPQQVSLALNTIEEVSTDIQSKGWWFNQQTASAYDETADIVIHPSSAANVWSSDIPEEARRYITIRASRIAQTRLIGSEELQKFSYNEELVSLAILQQAHVRNSNGVLDFTAFPVELRSLGMDEVMFLQGNVEEKIGTLRLGGELANIAKTKAEKLLIDAQELKTDEETKLITAQELKTDAEKLLIDAQELKTDAESGLVANQSGLVASQTTQLDAQTAIEATAEKAFYDGVVAGTQATYRDFAAELRIMGVQESMFQQTPAVKKVELLADAVKLRTATATEASPASNLTTTELSEVNKVMRFIGEPPVSALNSNSLASECVRLLRDTDTELQGRGWWFNTEEDVELTPSSATNTISVPNTILSLEAHDYDVRIQKTASIHFLYDLSKQSYQDWTSPIKCKVIYQRSLPDTPQKYREYLSVRVAILLTELYPKSGIDIQRLPKMELELRAYFKDREFDEANYSVFDNYDAASRIGINRNYDLA